MNRKFSLAVGVSMVALIALALVLIGTQLAAQRARQGQDGPAAAPKPAAESVRAAAESVNQFAFDLYAKLRTETQGNLFFSPQSISTALTMTYAGAAGETAAEMAKVLHLASVPADKLHPVQASLLAQLNEAGRGGQFQLTVANRIWGQQGYKFLDAFLKVLRDDYGAELAQLDFAQAEQSRQTINAWVEQATGGKIKDLIPSGVLNRMTRLVLTNAIYFKGNWTHQFNKDNTRPAPFFLSATEKIDVPMMQQKQRYKFGRVEFTDGKGVKLLELPYKGDRLSMVLLLPDAADGLADLEQHLTAQNVRKWTGNLAARSDVMVWLPKFTTACQFSLNDVLSSLGMPLAFSGEADFSGMDGTRKLYISAVVHKAFVDVNEEGTEAAAATGAVAAVTSLPPEFRADHPFAFLIRDDASGCILFLGRVCDPRTN